MMVVDVTIYVSKGENTKHYGKAVKSIDEAIEYLVDIQAELEGVKELKVDDCVKIVNTGAMYTTYSTFFIEEIRNSDGCVDNGYLVNLAARYDYGTSFYNGLKSKVEDKFIVKYISEKGIAVIERLTGSKIYLIDLDGLERC